MTIKFSDLPYAADALEPHVSARTLEFHHGKHHKAYVDKLNAAIAGTGYEGRTLESIIAVSHEAADAAVFNQASGEFEVALALRRGINVVVVEAVDAAGNVAYASELVNAKFERRTRTP